MNLSDRFSTAWLCRQLGVARSGFYDWRQRQPNPGPRAQENAAITAQIQTVFHRHRGFYGSPRVLQELRAAGLQVGRHRVARLMRRAVLKAQTRARVQALPQQQRQGRRCRREPPATRLFAPCTQPLLGW